jgi:ferredoxin
MQMPTILLILLGLVVVVSFGAFAFTSLREGQRRAAWVALGVAVAGSLPFFLASLLPETVAWGALAVVGVAAAAGIVLLVLPVGRVERAHEIPQRRIDERDIMFARARLEPGSPNYEAYYAMRPEKQAGDDMTRRLPGLLSPRASAFHPLAFASTAASFFMTEALREAVDGPVALGADARDRAAMTAFVKDLTEYYGAHTVGVAELKPYHIYSHIGRGSGEYGAPISLDHKYAIAFTVEMDDRMVRTAPHAPTVMESAREYVEAAKISVQLAGFIRELGHPARAHIDGNYQAIVPLVARDAGLGEIGRMGLLMTPSLGPRVRLGLVTTNLPLVPDERADTSSFLDFCGICKKCADCCPIHAIPDGDRQEIDGALRWRINDEFCFRYWHAVGTDCARCMSVCPYSHPNSAMHNVVRWFVRRSGVARRVVFRLDNAFYGSMPEPKPFPSWLPPVERKPRAGGD